jgi:uncharacterized phage-like protein YoqJ
MTTVKTPQKKQVEKLNEAVNEWLLLGEQIQKLKKQQEQLMQEVIEPFAVNYKSWFRDNKFELEAGYILWAAGRPKLVTAEGKTVTKQLKNLLVKRLPGEVVKQDVDITKLEKVLDENPLIRQTLEEYEVELVRMPSLQVKPYKAKKNA